MILSPQSSNLMNSTIRSKIFLEARRAGENTTISIGVESAKAAQKMAIEKVFPKRRGVEIKTSDGQLAHCCAR